VIAFLRAQKIQPVVGTSIDIINEPWDVSQGALAPWLDD